MTSPAGPSVSEIKAEQEFPGFSNCCLCGCKAEGSQALVLLVFMQQPAQHIPHQNQEFQWISQTRLWTLATNSAIMTPYLTPALPVHLRDFARICLKSLWQPCSKNKHLSTLKVVVNSLKGTLGTG